MKIKFDICIIGGAMTGMVIARALSKIGLRIAIIEKRSLDEINSTDARTTAISYQSMRILENIGVWELLASNAGPIEQIRVTDELSPLFLHFDNKDLDYPSPLGYLIENHYLLENLLHRVSSDNNITIFSPHSYKSVSTDINGAYITLDNGSEINCDLLIGADGRNSNIRDLFGIKATKISYAQSAVICTVSHERPHGRIACEMFYPEGPFAILPLKDQFKCSIVWTTKPELAQLLIKMSYDEFMYLLGEKFTDYLGTLKLESQRHAYPLSLSFTHDYIKQRMLIAGDAIHAIHPIAGQGFNLTVRDIGNIYELVKLYNESGLDIGSSSLLTSYQSARKIDNYVMIAATHGFNELFGISHPIVKIPRRLGMALLNKLPSLKKNIMEYAMGFRKLSNASDT